VLVVALGQIGLAAGKPDEQTIRFAIIGDRTGGHQPGIYEEIVREVEQMKPDFVLTVGDQIEGYTSDTGKLNQQWQEYKSLLAPLTMPVHLTPGNHDITTDGQLPAYERNASEPYYSFAAGRLHFIVLDASRWEKSEELPREQIEWLINDLKRNRKAAHTFVFYHKPFWYNSLAEGKPDTLHSIFRNFGVDYVFNGHFHVYISGAFDDITYTALGSSGGDAVSGPTGVQYHFTWVTVSREGVSIAPIKLNGVFPWNELTVAQAKAIDRIDARGSEFVHKLMLNSDFSLADSEAVLKIRNPASDAALDDTLRWTVPEGWTVAPEKLPVKLAPQDSQTLRFRIKHNGKTLFPLPSFTMRFPYAPGKPYASGRPVAIARQAFCYRTDAPYEQRVVAGMTQKLKSGAIGLLFDPEGGPMATEGATFCFAYDDTTLYLTALCRETKPDSMLTNARERDGAVYGDDCVGYFIQPDLAQGTAYQIYFSPLGTVFDQKITVASDGSIADDRTWNGSYEVKATKEANLWRLEARIPLKQFGVTAQAGQQRGGRRAKGEKGECERAGPDRGLAGSLEPRPEEFRHPELQVAAGRSLTTPAPAVESLTYEEQQAAD
jgi:hypothetical protein